ncbi:hypothetical protein R5W23_000750 [Gemmata sp. JC673]|uniref:Uncharacterized protein n=1 Tax=Gemmata algarum TaxID=2975278 RepID=A0ABU5EUB0_9BACT|nr:hypothetical protein [Gemmata algarum]MDY3558030.1 hypothetical protein [Gemmata algarum]
MDSILGLIRLIRLLYQFGQGSQKFVAAASGAINQADPSHAAALRRSYRQILRVTLGTFLFGCLGVPILAGCVAAWAHGTTVTDAALRALFGTMLSLLPALLYLFTGLALGCLLAPRSFLTSPAGAKWMELIGTRNISGARVICGAVVGCGAAAMGVIGTIIIVFMARMDT